MAKRGTDAALVVITGRHEIQLFVPLFCLLCTCVSDQGSRMMRDTRLEQIPFCPIDRQHLPATRTLLVPMHESEKDRKWAAGDESHRISPSHKHTCSLFFPSSGTTDTRTQTLTERKRRLTLNRHDVVTDLLSEHWVRHQVQQVVNGINGRMHGLETTDLLPNGQRRERRGLHQILRGLWSDGCRDAGVVGAGGGSHYSRHLIKRPFCVPL